MNLLLDTNIFLWLSQTLHRLSPQLLNTVVNPANQRYLSIVSIWELQIKYGIGKLSIALSPENFVKAHRRINDIQALPILEEHIWTLATLPHHHRDPFDRLLIAQAIHEGYTLVTSDALFANYPVQVMM